LNDLGGASFLPQAELCLTSAGCAQERDRGHCTTVVKGELPAHDWENRETGTQQ